VVGVDGSAPSRAAIRWGMRRAVSTGSRVVLAHILDDGGAPGGDGGGLEARMDADAQRSGHAFLESQLEFARLLDRRVAVTGELFRGDPLEALAAASEHMDLLAIGTHKTGFVQGRIFGSRFIQLAGLAFSPVAFVPNSAGGRRAGVVVGVGDVEADEATIRFAADEAARTREELTVIHCGVGRPADADVALTAAALARGAHPELSIRCRSLDRAPAEGLVDGSMSASLLVIGRSHRTIRRPGSIGSIVHDVLLNLNGPTVVVHDTAPSRRTFSERRLLAHLG
jgi:nucleotide-binding universal stress UspA family protein